MTTDSPGISPAVAELIRRGVVVHAPASVEVQDSVSPERVAPGVVLHAGCRLRGSGLSIGPGCEIGGEAPVTLEDCRLGHGVRLQGGTFSGSVFLDGAEFGSAAHVRPGTLLEEEAGAGHAVGFKHTILLSYVRAGSLINFCDALMSGGTSRRNHSEIGSSYIHFNFTPNQDKATASLIGDVPRGVMLDQPPVFLGGQGGLVGPARIAFGTVLPAGFVCREDVLDEDQLYTPTPLAMTARRFHPGLYRAINRVVSNNLAYIGNLWALRTWYAEVRALSMGSDPFREACRKGAVELVESAVRERVKRLGELAEAMRFSLEKTRTLAGQDLPPALRAQQEALQARWPRMRDALLAGAPREAGSADAGMFQPAWRKACAGTAHTEAVARLGADARRAGTRWLQGIVDSVAATWPKV
jgi:UDP-N-acetylglucosamine/UDP-N-acetylgalactosamine diphosphorylase